MVRNARVGLLGAGPPAWFQWVCVRVQCMQLALISTKMYLFGDLVLYKWSDDFKAVWFAHVRVHMFAMDISLGWMAGSLSLSLSLACVWWCVNAYCNCSFEVCCGLFFFVVLWFFSYVMWCWMLVYARWCLDGD